jgi:aspartyl-tRNA synthetase
VKGLNFKKGSFLSRKEIDEYTSLVSQFGFKGLAWAKKTHEGLQGPLAKFIDLKEIPAWIERFEIQEGDIIFLLAGGRKRLLQALDQLRRRIAKDHGLIDENSYEPLWVIDFPLFAWNEEEKKIECEHNPFTSPHLEDINLIEKQPLEARSSSYDLAINGYEMASGAQRIHDGALQEKVFRLIGLTEEECRDRFGFFVEALQYGTPPHLGIALGFDRLIMILTGTDSIRDVVAFPKNQRAIDPMTEAPSGVTAEQLKELGIKTQTGES